MRVLKGILIVLGVLVLAAGICTVVVLTVN